MRELTVVEMDEVGGGNPIVGGAVGAFGYFIGLGITGQSFSWSEFAGATVTGIFTGGFSAIGAGAVYSGTMGALAGGAAYNAATHYENLMSC